jgi:hypothetical protein
MASFIFAVLVLAAGIAGKHLGGYVGLPAPWWAWSLLTAVVVGLNWTFRVGSSLADLLKERTDARAKLQFCGGVHFPSLLMRESFSGSRLRIYDVRRTLDGIWERRLYTSAGSILMNRRRQRLDFNLPPGDRTRDEEFDNAAKKWEAFGEFWLETGFQRFIHAQDVPINDDIADLWLKEADDIEKEEKAREDDIQPALSGAIRST